MQHRAAAFTLLEMILVLAIAALVIGLGASSVARLTEEQELRQIAREAEGVLLQAVTRTLNTGQSQDVPLEVLGRGAVLTVRRAGAKGFVPAAGQRLSLRPGGLCEPLTLHWQKDSAWINATLDPLTGGVAAMEETL